MNINWEELFNNICIIVVAVGSAIKVIETQTNKKEKSEKKEVSRIIENSTELESDIIKQLENMKEETRADRVLLFEFHNGGHYADGRKALKTSCTFETNRYGIKAVQSELKDIVLSRFIKSITNLFKNGYIECKDVEKIKEEHGALYDLMVETDVKWFYSRVIRNEEFDPIGFILWEYCSDIDIAIDKSRVDETIGVIKEKLSELISK